MASAPHSIDPTGYIDDLLAQASPDLMRQMLQDTINLLLSAQADQVCGAEYGVYARVPTTPTGCWNTALASNPHSPQRWPPPT
ncbi:transposase [Corynebacterium efficiens YS-314]|uniref:Transposase n=1 Tax=Corynebacterium efficiens (strain DSM 44549 / YS-314 / AJ 12310 / JCM 11189 / NBRC 100395) TaxID=196164 RepID=Q8FLR1_COREF|nr:transposase [Corynebacterium efficiens YS-314]